MRTASYAPDSGSANSTALTPAGVFGNIEQQIVTTFGGGGPGGDWQAIEGCWVLLPKDTDPVAVVHFIGGAFVGAAPQLSYRLFLETLASRGFAVVATPFATSFDHIKIADQVQFNFNRCMSVLGRRVDALPVVGVGHSMGALLHMLINSRYVLPRAGNVLMSYNNRPATDAIPLLSPLILPSVKAVGPLLSALASNPLATTAMDRASDLLKGFGPSAVRQVVPLLEQLQPIYAQVAAGRQEFVPSPNETRDLIRTYYGVPRNLLLKFSDDELDQTAGLADVLQNGAAKSFLDMTVRSLSGDHIRPMQQDVPPEVVRAATNAVEQGSGLLSGIINMAAQAGPLSAAASAPLEDLAKNVSSMVADIGGRLSPNAPADISALVDELEGWIHSCSRPGMRSNALPAANGTAAAQPDA